MCPKGHLYALVGSLSCRTVLSADRSPFDSIPVVCAKVFLKTLDRKGRALFMPFSEGRFELRTRGSENKIANERTPPFCNLAASAEEEPRPKLSRNLVHFL